MSDGWTATEREQPDTGVNVLGVHPDDGVIYMCLLGNDGETWYDAPWAVAETEPPACWRHLPAPPK